MANETVMRYQVADYLNVGTSEEEEYELCGAGFTTLDEEPSAQTESQIYINDKSASSYVRSYESAFPFDSELIASERAVMALYDVGRNHLTGADAEKDYVRVELFKPIAEKTNTFEARKFRVSVEVSSISGEGGQAITVSGNLNSVGDFVEGEFDTTTNTFTAASDIA